MSDIAIKDKQAMDVLAKLPKEITSQGDYKTASDYLKALVELIKEIKVDFEDSIQAAHRAHKNVIAQRDAHIEPLKAGETHLRKLTGEWLSQQEKIKAEEKRLAEEKAKKDAETLKSFGMDEEALEIINTPVQVAAIQKNGIAYRDNWKFEIVDLELIPRQFMVPDESKIGQIARTMKEDAVIPGVKFFNEKSVIVR